MSVPIREQPYVPPASGGGPRKRRRWWPALLVLLAALVVGVLAATMGRLQTFEVTPAEATVQLDPKPLLSGDDWALLHWHWTYQVEATAEGYRSLKQELLVDDSSPSVLRLELEPLLGALRVVTDPKVTGEVSLEGKRVGLTGNVIEELEPGIYDVEVRARGYEPGRAEAKVHGYGAVDEITLELVALALVGTLTLSSDPAGADLLINGAAQGRAPQTLTGEVGAKLQVVALYPGHDVARATLTVREGAQKHTLRLPARVGTVELFPTPTNAMIRIDGELELRRKLELPQREHQIEVSAPGHITRTYRLTPHPESAARLSVRLLPESVAATGRRQKWEQEQKLQFVSYRPYESFAIETTRRKIPVRLTRPFAILDREVSNKLYRKFRDSHDSGKFKGKTLDNGSQPAVRMSWNDAALFANWASEQAGVAPFYRMKDGQVRGFDASAIGYRLPTDAEWVWLTRREGRFAWGDGRPPNRFANMADRTASKLLSQVSKEYTDGFEVSAPVGSLQPVTRGKLYDLPGNVAEWIHDVYGSDVKLLIDTGGRGVSEERVDPLGVAKGQFHVVRGFSWRTSSQRELSLAYRNYGAKGKLDVGFRLAYYLDPK